MPNTLLPKAADDMDLLMWVRRVLLDRSLLGQRIFPAICSAGVLPRTALFTRWAQQEQFQCKAGVPVCTACVKGKHSCPLLLGA